MSIRVDRDWVLPDGDVVFNFVRSSGPGGQNVNKVASKVELRFQLATSRALSSAQKERLKARYPRFVTQTGEFVLASDRFRSQERNHDDAVSKLTSMLRSIRRPPKRRVATKPTRASKLRRLETKRRQAKRKRERRQKDFD